MLKRTNNLLFENSAVYELLISVPKTQNQQLIEGIHETNQIILQLLAFIHLIMKNDCIKVENYVA